MTVHVAHNLVKITIEVNITHAVTGLLFKKVKALNSFLDKLDTSKTEAAETKIVFVT